MTVKVMNIFLFVYKNISPMYNEIRSSKICSEYLCCN